MIWANGMIWQRATKETHSNLPIVELATFLAVSHFNDEGSKALVLILETLSTVPGSHCTNACRKLDQRRIKNAQRKSTEGAKKKKTEKL